MFWEPYVSITPQDLLAQARVGVRVRVSRIIRKVHQTGGVRTLGRGVGTKVCNQEEINRWSLINLPIVPVYSVVNRGFIIMVFVLLLFSCSGSGFSYLGNYISPSGTTDSYKHSSSSTQPMNMNQYWLSSTEGKSSWTLLSADKTCLARKTFSARMSWGVYILLVYWFPAESLDLSRDIRALRIIVLLSK